MRDQENYKYGRVKQKMFSTSNQECRHGRNLDKTKEHEKGMIIQKCL